LPLPLSLLELSPLVQPVEALSSKENLLKVPLCGTFNKFSGFYKSAKRCIKLKIQKRKAARSAAFLFWILCPNTVDHSYRKIQKFG